MFSEKKDSSEFEKLDHFFDDLARLLNYTSEIQYLNNIHKCRKPEPKMTYAVSYKRHSASSSIVQVALFAEEHFSIKIDNRRKQIEKPTLHLNIGENKSCLSLTIDENATILKEGDRIPTWKVRRAQYLILKYEKALHEYFE